MRPIFLLRGIRRMYKRPVDTQSRLYRVYRVCVAQRRFNIKKFKYLARYRVASDRYMFNVILSRGMVILVKIACKIGFGGYTQAALIRQRRFVANRLWLNRLQNRM